MERIRRAYGTRCSGRWIFSIFFSTRIETYLRAETIVFIFYVIVIITMSGRGATKKKDGERNARRTMNARNARFHRETLIRQNAGWRVVSSVDHRYVLLSIITNARMCSVSLLHIELFPQYYTSPKTHYYFYYYLFAFSGAHVKG